MVLMKFTLYMAMAVNGIIARENDEGAFLSLESTLDASY